MLTIKGYAVVSINVLICVTYDNHLSIQFLGALFFWKNK
ncbi:protein of unknown function [Latilactobacillus sakei]|nr:protein of unknown function [Latilactobacillus sakei]